MAWGERIREHTYVPVHSAKVVSNEDGERRGRKRRKDTYMWLVLGREDNAPPLDGGLLFEGYRLPL
jgi:hypothetical protein